MSDDATRKVHGTRALAENVLGLVEDIRAFWATPEELIAAGETVAVVVRYAGTGKELHLRGVHIWAVRRLLGRRTTSAAGQSCFLGKGAVLADRLARPLADESDGGHLRRGHTEQLDERSALVRVMETPDSPFGRRNSARRGVRLAVDGIDGKWRPLFYGDLGRMERVEFSLLGGFDVRVDGASVPAGAWTGRARDLVKLLAITPEHRLARERAVDTLWPRLDADAGLSNLHKAAHHARRALGDPGAVVLRGGQVLLAPEARVETDIERFEATSDAELYRGELLPDDRYAEWTQERRSELRERYLEALRTASRWEELAAEEPADEPAQRAVMRARLASGDRPGALRAFERLRAALEEVGLRPSVETLALHARIAGGAALDKALAVVEAELAQASVSERKTLLATRADLLFAIGDRAAAAAYAEAAGAAGPEGMALRIRQAWAQLAIGDPTAARATLAPLAPVTGAERAARLIAEAAAAWFSGDVEAARRAAAEAQPLAVAAGCAVEARTAIQIQTMVAHSSGEWPAAVQQGLEQSLRAPELADTLFDGHLCVAEYVLTSGEPHARIRAVADDLHAHALRAGARRAQAFAATLLGEVALIAGSTQHAEPLLREAVRVSREIGAVSAEALASVRLGEARRARGDRAEGDALLTDGLVISRWSPISGHLQPLAYAALLRATDQAELCRERLDDAEAHLRGEDLVCAYCGHAFHVAAAIAAARAGLPERAASALMAAEGTAALWKRGPWPAALEEARGELAGARGQRQEALDRLRAASRAFATQGWRLDADRLQARLVALA